jgi:NADH-quinone oxidoreductase subunit L
MAHVATLILLMPLVGFLLVMLLGQYLKEKQVGYLATIVVGVSFALTVIAFFLLLGHSSRQVTVNLFSWINVGTLHVPAALSSIHCRSPCACSSPASRHADPPLLHWLHARGEGLRKFFLYLNLFVFSMLLLVLANNLVLTFVGWEGVGLCSYWLVSFYFDRDKAASAGKKAFIYNRVGDVGMLVAMFLLFSRTHTLTYLSIFAEAGSR